MSERLVIRSETLTDLADKVRVLSGTEGILTPSEMSNELDAFADKAIVVNEGETKTVYMPNDYQWVRVIFADNRFVAIAQNSNIAAYSTDGMSWEQTELPKSQSWCDLAYGNGMFIAIGGKYGATDTAAYSNDGITWNPLTLPASSQWRCIVYGEDKFVIFSAVQIIYSTNGVDWEYTPSMVSTGALDVIYANGKFVVVGTSNKTYYSTDGIGWTENTFPVSSTGLSIAYGADKFVVIGYNTDVVAYSEDGITWNTSSLPNADSFYSLVYGNGKFIATTSANKNAAVYSEDGVNWSNVSLSQNGYWSDITFGNGIFLTINCYYKDVIYSYDGINWSNTYIRQATLSTVRGVDVTDQTIQKVMSLDDELSAQDELISDIIAALDGKAAAGSIEPVIETLSITENGTYTAPSGVHGYSPVKVTVPTGNPVEIATPKLSIDSATGIVTATSTQEAGIVTSGTKTGELKLTTKAATTITPGTSAKTAVSSGIYTTGDIIVKGDSNLVASNIASGKSIFGETGTYSECFTTSMLQNSVTTSRTFVAPSSQKLANAWNNGNCMIFFVPQGGPPVSGSYIDLHSGYITCTGSTSGICSAMVYNPSRGVGAELISMTVSISGSTFTLTPTSGFCWPAATFYVAMCKT